MKTVVRNAFARFTIFSERVNFPGYEVTTGCTQCGWIRTSPLGTRWLLRFHLIDDQSNRNSEIAKGKLFCSRQCCEAYIGHKLGA